MGTQHITLLRDLSLLHPDMKVKHEMFVTECSNRGIRIITTNTWRPLETQDQLYAQGRTAPGRKVTSAKPGQSPHNYVLLEEDGSETPASLAFDMVPVVKGELVWDHKNPVNNALWDYVGAIGESFGLVWGKKFNDRPHMEMVGAKELLKQRFPEAWK